MKDFNLNDILRPSLPKILPQKGRIIIAEPFMEGFYFSRSVILLIKHKEDEEDAETIGLVLNKTSDINPNELVNEFDNYTGVLYLGGPVAPNSLHFLHTLGDVIPESEKITENVYYGGDFEILTSLIKKGKANMNNVKFFAGYTGWVSKQLQNELDETAWIVSTIEDTDIMKMNYTDLWSETLERLGNIYKTWINIPMHPVFN